MTASSLCFRSTIAKNVIVKWGEDRVSKWLYEACLSEEWKRSTGIQKECRVSGGLCVGVALVLQ
jgi:hypothetical protein